MRAWVRDHGLSCSQPKFKARNLNLFTAADYPELKAKAHNCRVLVAWMAGECARFRDGQNGALRAACTWALARFAWLGDSHDHWKLPEALATEMFDVGHHFLQCYKALANQAIRDNKKLWSWKPKLHYYEHFLDILNQEKINYVYLWNFSEEDLIGTSSSIASMTHRLVVPSRTLDRYYIRCALVWGSRNVVSTGPPEWL